MALASSDCVEIDFTFGLDGKSTFDVSKEVLSKREQGDSYGMVAYANAAKEWYAQADAFDAACVGKTGAEIAGLKADDGKGVDKPSAKNGYFCHADAIKEAYETAVKKLNIK